VTSPSWPGRRPGIAGLRVGRFVAVGIVSVAAVMVFAPSVAQVHQDGLRTPQQPLSRDNLQRPRHRSRTPDRFEERPERPVVRRRQRNDSRRRPDPSRPAQVNLSLPSWAGDSIGLHPVRLSVNVQSELQRYLRQEYPLVFVLSRHGRYASWRYCRPGGRCSAATAVRAALRRCDGIRIDNPCYVYAVGRKTVWKGKVENETALGGTVHTAADTTLHGPAKARGIVFYFRGYGAWRFPPALSYSRVPPYLHRFARDGWDIKTVEVPYYNRPPVNLPRIIKLVHRTVAAARAEGYRKVVLAGQSRGAWEILGASDGTLPVDGVIIVAPAAHGTRYLRNGRRNLNFDRGNPAFQALAQRLKAPRIAFAFFRRDPFMLSSRAGLARTALEGRPGVSTFLIDRPAGLLGHNSGWSSNFARAWGGCLEKFVESPARPGAFTCGPARFKIDTPELIYSADQLFEHGAQRVTPAALKALVNGKRLFTAPEPRDDGWWDFGQDGKVVMKLPGDWMRPNPVKAYWETRGSRICVIDSPIHGSRVFCYTVFKVTDNVLAFLMKSRIVRLMYIR
jgi:hypothetical protein